MKNIILIFALSILTSCTSENLYVKSSNNEQIIKFTIYPTGTFRESYYFTLNSNGELVTEKGTRVTDDVTEYPFLETCDESSTKELTVAETNTVFQLANEIYDGNCISADSVAKDSWDVQIFYKGKVVRQNWHEVSLEVKKLMDIFIELSPIEVDFHDGWA